MQQDLAKLELEPRVPSENRGSSNSAMSSQSSRPDPQRRSSSGDVAQQNPLPRTSVPGFTATYEHTNAAVYQNLNRRSLQQFGGYQALPPKPSPFPKLVNPGDNVPLSDDEKEEVLERARSLVLKSTDPEMQLAWAQDALTWVEIQSQSYARHQEADGALPRPSTPEVEHNLRVDALSIVSFLADQHHPKGEFMKGLWLEFGKFGFAIDKKEGFLAYRRAAERGYARAEYRIGMQFESSNNPAKAIEYYQKGVAMKDSAANYRLGMMTLLGQHGAQQNYQRGVDLIRFSAETADENAPQGAYVYGLLLARELPNISIPDQFLPYDFNEAKLFIEKAAYLGFAKAQLKMGQAYELCQLGCEFDPALSLHYNTLAARQGESEADMAISKWFLCGYEGVFEKNEELAFKYAKRAAQVKMATAEFAMGYFYEIGMYVPIDLRESEKWYQKAGEHGNKDALGRIDSIKKNNAFSKKDHEQIAISRIKSQHGSQRGKRPDRFRQRPPVLPAMSEDVVDMPDPRNSYAGAMNQEARLSSNNPLGPVALSAAPYPDDDMPPPNPPYFNSSIRPSSAGGPRADHPSSAFGIRPLQHAPTEPYDHRGGSVSSGWEPQAQMPIRSRDSSLPSVHPGQSPSFDQGRNRLPSNNFSQPQPQPYSGPGYGRQGGGNIIPRRDPAANQFQRPERGSSMTPVNPVLSPPNQQPDRFHSVSPMQNPRRNSPGQSQAQPYSTGPRRASPRPLQQTMSSHNSAPGTPMPPPKKSGPATFEEMGIPAAKNENDCVRLLLLPTSKSY
jgi:TPR repeat protein